MSIAEVCSHVCALERTQLIEELLNVSQELPYLQFDREWLERLPSHKLRHILYRTLERIEG